MRLGGDMKKLLLTGVAALSLVTGTLAKILIQINVNPPDLHEKLAWIVRWSALL
jgi:hypothetical protein